MSFFGDIGNAIGGLFGGGKKTSSPPPQSTPPSNTSSSSQQTSSSASSGSHQDSFGNVYTVPLKTGGGGGGSSGGGGGGGNNQSTPNTSNPLAGSSSFVEQPPTMSTPENKAKVQAYFQNQENKNANDLTAIRVQELDSNGNEVGARFFTGTKNNPYQNEVARTGYGNKEGTFQSNLKPGSRLLARFGDVDYDITDQALTLIKRRNTRD